jgi:alkanesulfonate monooxygenase SsuD/methylene tetrahydromethanopterin reductase-like flavin-dependent oxidoreductase (luciferase family)
MLLCTPHHAGIARDAVKAAELYGELALTLAGGSGQGERTSGSRDRAIPYSDRASDARATIQAVLAAWCSLISEQRGIYPPKRRVVKLLPYDFIGPPPLVWTLDDRPRVMAAYIAEHADWLAAHPAAGDCSAELADLVRMAHPIAYPTGTRVIDVGPCVEPGCPGTIRAVLRRADSLLPSALACSEDDGHTWPPHQWRTIGRQLQARTEAAA